MKVKRRINNENLGQIGVGVNLKKQSRCRILIRRTGRMIALFRNKSDTLINGHNLLSLILINQFIIYLSIYLIYHLFNLDLLGLEFVSGNAFNRNSNLSPKWFKKCKSCKGRILGYNTLKKMPKNLFNLSLSPKSYNVSISLSLHLPCFQPLLAHCLSLSLFLPLSRFSLFLHG